MVGKSERYRNAHTSNYSELHPNQQVWMQHHISGKWDTKVTVRMKRKEGNSYVVCAEDGNTYIRGRRLLKPINHPQYLIPSRTPRDISTETEEIPKSQESDQNTSTPKRKTNSTETPKKKTKSTEVQKMPRRSPRNHKSSRSADTEIAARLTTFHIYHIQDGETGVEAKAGGGGRAQGEDQQPNKHRDQHWIPPPGISRSRTL